ncbi:unnamed protein product [Gadus morhua 'NCC']
MRRRGRRMSASRPWPRDYRANEHLDGGPSPSPSTDDAARDAATGDLPKITAGQVQPPYVHLLSSSTPQLHHCPALGARDATAGPAHSPYPRGSIEEEPRESPAAQQPRPADLCAAIGRQVKNRLSAVAQALGSGW